MNKISINHIKGIYKYNNYYGIFYRGAFLNLHIMHSINEAIENDLIKFGVKDYDMCFFLGNINNIYAYHKSNKKWLRRRKKIGL